MPTIDVKTAVSAALNYFNFLQDNISKEIQTIRLEEVELSEDKNYWLITLGYDVPVKNQFSGIIPTLAPVYKREYKLFKVNSETSEVESMKIRTI